MPDSRLIEMIARLRTRLESVLRLHNQGIAQETVDYMMRNHPDLRDAQKLLDEASVDTSLAVCKDKPADWEKRYNVRVEHLGQLVTMQWFEHLYAAEGFAEAMAASGSFASVYKHEVGKSVLTDELRKTFSPSTPAGS